MFKLKCLYIFIILKVLVSCNTQHTNPKEALNSGSILSTSLSKSDSLKYHIEDSIRFNMDKGELLNPYQSLILSYSADGCTCANWLILRIDNINREEIYLEPANESIANADTLYNGENIPIKILVVGKFYSKKGYPRNYFPTKGDPQPARVFHYSSIKVIKRGK